MVDLMLKKCVAVITLLIDVISMKEVILTLAYTALISHVWYTVGLKEASKDNDLLQVKLAQCNEVLRGGK